jgi:hypothetical protein
VYSCSAKGVHQYRFTGVSKSAVLQDVSQALRQPSRRWCRRYRKIASNAGYIDLDFSKKNKAAVIFQLIPDQAIDVVFDERDGPFSCDSYVIRIRIPVANSNI